MKNFVKAMNKEGAGFRYLRQMFPRISDAKIKEGIFVGPQIRHVMNDEHFEEMLVGPEKVAWRAFKDVVENFLGNHRAQNYSQLVKKLLSAYKAMKCNMSLKIHFLHSATNKVKGFTKTFQRWKRDIRATGIHQCWLITVGHCNGMRPTLNTNGNQQQNIFNCTHHMLNVRNIMSLNML